MRFPVQLGVARVITRYSWRAYSILYPIPSFLHGSIAPYPWLLPFNIIRNLCPTKAQRKLPFLLRLNSNFIYFFRSLFISFRYCNTALNPSTIIRWIGGAVLFQLHVFRPHSSSRRQLRVHPADDSCSSDATALAAALLYPTNCIKAGLSQNLTKFPDCVEAL